MLYLAAIAIFLCGLNIPVIHACVHDRKHTPTLTLLSASNTQSTHANVNVNANVNANDLTKSLLANQMYLNDSFNNNNDSYNNNNNNNNDYSFNNNEMNDNSNQSQLQLELESHTDNQSQSQSQSDRLSMDDLSQQSYVHTDRQSRQSRAEYTDRLLRLSESKQFEIENNNELLIMKYSDYLYLYCIIVMKSLYLVTILYESDTPNTHKTHTMTHNSYNNEENELNSIHNKQSIIINPLINEMENNIQVEVDVEVEVVKE